MATYGKQFKWNPPRRKKQRYALVERVVDFSKVPVTSGLPESLGSEITTAWASGDVLQAIQIRAGQTVLGVQVEVITAGTNGTSVDIGDGDYSTRYGKVKFRRVKVGSKLKTGWETADLGVENNFRVPKYYGSADTIDLVLAGTITAGKIRIIVHLLEDDR